MTTWSIIEEAGKIFLVKDGKTLKTTQLWDRTLARQNPTVLAPGMFDVAMKVCANKLSNLGDGPAEQDIVKLIKELRVKIAQ